MDNNEQIKWATAIANRISDEWSGSRNFPEDAAFTANLLQKTLSEDIEATRSFIGTGIIESDYFQKYKCTHNTVQPFIHTFARTPPWLAP